MSFEWLPGAPEVEKHVLGAILFDADEASVSLEQLQPGDFSVERHGSLFGVMRELYLAAGKVEIHLLLEALRKLDNQDEVMVQHFDFLRELACEVVTAGNIEAHSQLVKKLSIRRRLITGANQLRILAGDERKENDQVLADAESLVMGLAEERYAQGFVRYRDALPETIKLMARIQAGELMGFPTGFRDIDAITGGFQKTDMIVLAGRPGMGKTSLALSIALRAAREKKVRIGFFSLEMGIHQLMQRSLCSLRNVNLHHLRIGRLFPEDQAKLAEAAHALKDIPLFIDDASRKTPLQILSQAKRLKKKHGLDLLMFDYLQLGSLDKETDTRAEEVGEFARGLKAIAKDIDIPVVALAQLSRKVEDRVSKVPQLADLRESGEIEQAADIVGFLYRPEVYDKSAEHGLAEIHWAKYRNGPGGEVTRITFNKESASFSDYVEPSILEGAGYGNSHGPAAGTHRAGSAPRPRDPSDPGPQYEPARARPPRPGEAGYD